MTLWKWVAVLSALFGLAWPWLWLVAIVAMEIDRGGADVIAVWAEGRINRHRE